MSGVRYRTALIGEEQRHWNQLPWTFEGVGSYRFNHILSDNANNIVANMRSIIGVVGVSRLDSLDEGILDVYRTLPLGCK